MKKLSTFLLASVLAILTFAQDAVTKVAPLPVAKDKDASVAPMIPVSAATLTAPLVLKDGAISQPAQTEVAEGGKAIFAFTVPKAGNYVIHAIVNAPGEETNSFYVNVDAQPEDPLMIWDIAVTNGFEERIVSWRGNGDDTSDEFIPKRFNLAAGAHKLVIVGREPAFLKSVSIRPAAN